MKTGASLKNRQGGAVAVVVGISIFLLVGFLAMVIDLGHLYIAKTELQNAADAAALSGAKQLNGTKLGVNDTITNKNGAVQWATATAAKNYYDFSSKPVDIDINDIWVGNCPEDSCMVAASSIATDADAAGKFFLKVHTRNRDLIAYFAPIWNIFHVSTFGMAVAGPIMQNVAPLAVCALIPGSPATEYGFRRGVSYNIIEVNGRYIGVGGFTSVPLFLNPVDIPPAACNPSNGSDSFMNPFVCQGISALSQVSKGSLVYVNTGITSSQNKSFNSRFNDYTGSQCDMATAPPDKNIREFLPPPPACTPPVCSPYITASTCNAAPGCKWNGSAKICVPSNPPPANCNDYVNWMNPPYPVQQSMTPINASGVAPTPNDFAHYGVLWSHAWESKATPQLGLADWPTLYAGGSAVPNSYPASGVPYTQTTGNYFQQPTGGGAAYATANRRVINMVLVNCPLNMPSSCLGEHGMPGQTVPVLDIVSFFMTKPAGLPDRLDVEFGRVVPIAELKRQYRLFR